ncbi:MAG: VCBS repeat-containing protein [Acidobacteria bacterium]|nr:VCBS repeat-containing protein [Acidobacteriota bacterium]
MKFTKLSPKTQNLLGCGVLLVAGFLGLAGYGVWKLYSFFSNIRAAVSREIPDELAEAKVFRGDGFLRKTEFFKLTKEDLFTTIGKSTETPDEKERQKIVQSQIAKGIYNFADLRVVAGRIVAAGEFGAYVLDPAGNLEREILFEPTVRKIKIGWYEKESYETNLDNLRIVELEKNRFGFASFGSMQGFRVFDENGNQIWSYGREETDLSNLFDDEKKQRERYEKSTHVLEAAVGDLDGDGVSEYVVARKSDGIRVFDRDGREKWFEEDEFPSRRLLIVDLDGDGRNELVETGSPAKVRDAAGKIVRKIENGISETINFQTEDKNKKKVFVSCILDQNRLTCRDENKQTVLDGAAPLSDVPAKNPQTVTMPDHPEISYTNDRERTYDERAVRVALAKDRPKYLAVLASFISIPRADLYVYDEKGTLVYHELLPEDAETIAVVPAAGGTDEILVGGKDTIWKYAAP